MQRDADRAFAHGKFARVSLIEALSTAIDAARRAGGPAAH